MPACLRVRVPAVGGSEMAETLTQDVIKLLVSDVEMFNASRMQLALT
jgi:hypothetical protein